MTEQEAIIRLTKEIDILNKAPVHVNKLHDVEIAVEARKNAISALEEIQQYQALEQRAKNLFGENYDLFNCVEELREARKKQVPKKPTKSKSSIWSCSCGLIIQNKNKRNCLYFCHNCGQAIDWSDTE